MKAMLAELSETEWGIKTFGIFIPEMKTMITFFFNKKLLHFKKIYADDDISIKTNVKEFNLSEEEADLINKIIETEELKKLLGEKLMKRLYPEL